MDLFPENRRNRGLAFEDFPEEEAQKAARDATGANAVRAPSLALYLFDGSLRLAQDDTHAPFIEVEQMLRLGELRFVARL
jgi:hypothetical protein